MRWAAIVMAALTAVAPGAGQGLKTPGDWKWVPDAPAKVIETAEAKPDAMYFVAMPPGWHITQGPGALLYQPDYQGRGNFVVETEMFLFPDSSTEEYGVFLGGKSLDAPPRTYLAFVGRRDGQAAVLERKATGVVPVFNWAASAVAPQKGPDAVKNVFKVEVGTTELTFSANGTVVTKLPRASLATDGPFGLRVGKGINIHVSRLDLTHRLAPTK
ncbi:MAG TPA: hypothetical protein VES67_17455 [Vicinamibacterales bacterium]|nr:hypothetical protein [Vicinamibacterales bacterium]